ncbi:MAG: choice-of-anchor D domain-containing protein [Planctomycetes bacterium]|nr:choice-of-anchor D domain-containing protein [Planctomycetota bacterium]MCW8135302.1 choice-of-anchor D domain-containing protein [Planctomycetota bacterium]
MIRAHALLLLLAPVLAAQGWTHESRLFNERCDHSTVVFNSRIWVMGGFGGSFWNDVWYTTDGVDWTLATGEAAWSRRHSHGLAVHNGRMWLLGGYDSDTWQGGFRQDVWSSADGVNWTLETASAPWAGRMGHGVLAFNGKLWVLGGYSQSGRQNDVWSSADGINWTQETAAAAWSTRWYMATAVFSNRMWVIGGSAGGGANGGNDVWYSTNGSNWTKAFAGGPGRQKHAAVVHGNRLWIIGGCINGVETGDVISSSDGVQWRLETTTGPARSGHTCAAFNNQLWVLGGMSNPVPTPLSEVWSSNDGRQWTLNATSVQWNARRGHGSAVHDNRLWVMGGEVWVGNVAPPQQRNDVWSSLNGKDWTRHTQSAPWSARIGHACVGFNHRLWVLGGWNGSSAQRDVWFTQDGSSWTLATSAAPWGARTMHTALVFGGKLWVIGGFDNAGKNDVWSSPDGFTWTQETASAPFTPRFGHASAVFNGRMWVIGGVYGSADVWSSSDGINWTLETASAGFTARFAHKVSAFNNRLWLTGGADYLGPSLNDVWSSVDGVTWTQEPTPAWPPRRYHAQEVFGGRIWLMAGAHELDRSDVWSFAQPQPTLEVREGGKQLAHNEPSAGSNREFAPLAIGGGPSAYLTITLRNAGSANLQLAGATLVGDAADFDLDASNLPVSLAPPIVPGNTTTIAIAFAPQSAGSKMAWIEIDHNDAAQPRPWRIEVSGVGLPPAAPVLQVRENGPGGTLIANGAAAAGNRDFGYTEVGTLLPAISMYIQNVGTADLLLGTPIVTGDYILDTSMMPPTLAPGAGATFKIALSAQATGAKPGTVSFSHNDITTTDPFTFDLSAVVYAPGVPPAPGHAKSTPSTGCTTGGAGLPLGLLLPLLFRRRREPK